MENLVDKLDGVIEYIALNIFWNFGDFLLLLLCWILTAVIWTLPFVIVFSPVYYDDICCLYERFTDYIKRITNDNKKER